MHQGAGSVAAAACVPGAPAQRWAGLDEARWTTAAITAAPAGGGGAALCLATDGAALFVEPCELEPANCSEHRCKVSARVRQLWYKKKSEKNWRRPQKSLYKKLSGRLRRPEESGWNLGFR
eukprot:gene17937-biopygen8111